MPVEVRLEWETMYPYILPGYRNIESAYNSTTKKRKFEEVSRSDNDDDEVNSSQKSTKKRHFNDDGAVYREELPLILNLQPQAN